MLYPKEAIVVLTLIRMFVYINQFSFIYFKMLFNIYFTIDPSQMQMVQILNT